MDLLHDDEFDALFVDFKRSAFHLELKDSYDTPEERGPFDLFLEGKPDDFAWFQPWLKLVEDTTGAGKEITRARVVTVPHCDYTRWGLTVAPFNISAGEDIRWLPRHLSGGIDFPKNDYWLFDDERLVWTVFAEDGTWLGGVEEIDETLIEQCVKAQREVWKRAIPHDQYVVSEFAAQ